MYEFTDVEIKELNTRNLLAEDGHPAFDAFKQVFSSPSADFDELAINIEKHGRDCPICSERYKRASNETAELRKKQL